MNQEIKNRLKSLAWRVGMVALAVLLDGIAKMCSDGTIQIPTTYVVLVGLILGEISKAINNRLSEKS